MYQGKADEAIDAMLKADVIRPSQSEWAAPVILVPKKDGTIRFCVDFRALNAVTKKDVYPLPRIDDVIDALAHAKVFSTLDLASGYWQIPVAQDDISKTAFVTRRGLYEFTRMPFGLCNAPSTFQRAMDVMLSGLTWEFCLVYIDDIIVYSANFEQHLKHLGQVFDRVRAAGYHLRRDKCHFFCSRVLYLGHLIGADGVGPDPSKIAALKKLQGPRDAHEIRQFLGLTGYYRRFVKDYAKTAKPLNDLLRIDRKFKWTSDCQDAFERLRFALITAPILVLPDMEQPFALQTDASDVGVGAVLTQRDSKGDEHVVAYYSRTLGDAETRYSTFEKEALAALLALKHFRVYLLSKPFVLETDNRALTFILNLKEPPGRIARWIVQFQEYNFTIKHRPGLQNGNADTLSRPYVISSNMTSGSAEDFQAGESNDFSRVMGAVFAIDLVTPPNVDLRREQYADPEWAVLIDFLEKGVEPKEVKERHRLHSVVSQYTIAEGTLRHQWIPWRGARDHVFKRVCVPKSMRHSVLIGCHADAMAGHLGCNRTYDRLVHGYYWTGMRRDCEEFCTTCAICQAKKTDRRGAAGQLQPILAAYPFHKVAVDAVVNLPKTARDNKHLIVFTDLHSKYAMAFPAKDLTTETFATLLLEEIILQQGCPAELLSDQGGNFTSNLVKEICRIMMIKKITTTPYHPRTDGQTERLNHSLIQILRTQIQSDPRDWDTHVRCACYAYNTSVHKTTGMTPFYMIYGRDPLMPLDLSMGLVDDDLSESEEVYVKDLLNRLMLAQKIARDHTELAQQRAAVRFNAKRREQHFSVGEQVWVRRFAVKPGEKKKLLSQWEGPFTVINCRGPLNYQLQLPPSRRIISAHVENMKIFKTPIDLSEHEIDVSETEANRLRLYDAKDIADVFTPPKPTMPLGVPPPNDIEDDLEVDDSAAMSDQPLALIPTPGDQKQTSSTTTNEHTPATSTTTTTTTSLPPEGTEMGEATLDDTSDLKRHGNLYDNAVTKLEKVLLETDEKTSVSKVRTEIKAIITDPKVMTDATKRARIRREIGTLTNIKDVLGYVEDIIQHAEEVF